MKTVYIYNNGCIENVQSAEQFYNYLSTHNFKLINNPRGADLLIVNTCAVAKLKVIFSIRKIRELQSIKKRTAMLAVSGCLPRIDGESLRKIFDGPIIDVRDPNDLARLINSPDPVSQFSGVILREAALSDYKNFIFLKRILSTALLRRIPFFAHVGNRIREYEDHQMFYIKIAQGCLGNCSYCAIKIAKGRLKSRPMDVIVSEFREALARGYKRIILCGDETGSYGLDMQSSFSELLDRLISFEGDYKIGIRSLSPGELIKYFSVIECAAKKNKISLLSVPIQSGSNRILAAMKRNYTVEDAVFYLKKLKDKYPNIMLRTHFVIGFPGETADDFRKTMQVVDAVDFDCVIPVIFSAMKGTEAFCLKGQVPLLVRNARFFRILLKSLCNTYL